MFGSLPQKLAPHSSGVPDDFAHILPSGGPSELCSVGRVTSSRS